MPTKKTENLPIKKTRKKVTKKTVSQKDSYPAKTKKTVDLLKEGNNFPIVGIGSSAGGLEALELFFSNVPPNTNMAFVIIQHLSPRHKSIMADILMKYTHMKVLQIVDDLKIEPNKVYLNPPDKNVVILNRRLNLTEPTQTHGVNLPIDCFFRSLSEDQHEKAKEQFFAALNRNLDTLFASDDYADFNDAVAEIRFLGPRSQGRRVRTWEP